jgi:hypothetical protein
VNAKAPVYPPVGPDGWLYIPPPPPAPPNPGESSAQYAARTGGTIRDGVISWPARSGHRVKITDPRLTEKPRDLRQFSPGAPRDGLVESGAFVLGTLFGAIIVLVGVILWNLALK